LAARLFRIADAKPKDAVTAETRTRDAPALRIEDAVNTHCPWSGKPIAADALTLYNGAVVGFCDPACRDRFARAVDAFEDALRARRVENAGLHQ